MVRPHSLFVANIGWIAIGKDVIGVQYLVTRIAVKWKHLCLMLIISWNIMKSWKCFETESRQVYFELDALIICGHPISIPCYIHLKPITP